MLTAFRAIIRGPAGTVHQVPIPEFVWSAYTHLVQVHMVSIASPLLDDMHGWLTVVYYTCALASFRAAHNHVTLHLYLTAALPAMSSCIRIGPHCLTFYTPEEHNKKWTAQVQQHLPSIAIAGRYEPARSARTCISWLLWFWSSQDQLNDPEHAFDNCCCHDC